MKWLLVFIGILINQTFFAQHQLAFLKPALRDVRVEVPVAATEYKSVAFEIRNNMIYVKASIDGEMGLCIIDTGCPSVVVNRTVDSPQASVAATTLSSNLDVHETTIGRLKLGALELKDVSGLAIDFDQFAGGHKEKTLGLVGYTVLKDFEVLLDFDSQRVHLFPPAKSVLHRTARPCARVKLSMEGHLPVATVEMGSRTFRFGLDSGAATNILDRDLLAGLPDELIEMAPAEEFRCLDGPYQRVEAGLVRGLSMDGYPLETMKFLFVDLSRINENAEEKLDGLLGYAFFSQLLSSINYHQKYLYIWERTDHKDSL